MFPLNKGITTPQAHVNIPDGLYEEELGRDGFYGPVTHLYHQHPPTGWTRIEGPLKPHAIDGNKITGNPSSADAISSRTPVLFNEDVTLHVCKPGTPMDYYFRNADADEVYFIHRGQGVIETDFGPLQYEPGDYIVLPRGTTYRISPDPDKGKHFFLLIESYSRIRQPDRGMLGQHALYDPGVIKTPTPDLSISAKESRPEWELKIQRQQQLTSVFYPFNPINVVGWKGDLTVWQLNVRDICPVLSHKAHLPPSVHTTFLARGFVICSFLPRPLETAPGAEKVPFYHRNIDYDEVLFYHDGDFFSREGIDTGMFTFHPQGIHHGPHPGAVEASKHKTETNEVAVMVDTQKPLQLSEQAKACEWPGYAMSWQPKTHSK
ncbi:MAG: homogentisate 1,2-dioxygenase [Cyanobacteria bacterium]|nr:homogentisate 1,2-dioxygenase [Cyanobacteriota bacterium]